MNRSRLQYLLTRYTKGDIEKTELRELLELIDANNLKDIDRELDRLITEYLDVNHKSKKFDASNTLQKIWSRLAEQETGNERELISLKRRSYKTWWVAATLVGALLMFAILLTRYQTDNLQGDVIAMENDILLPNQAQVRLSLNNGTIYNLMETDKSVLDQEGIEMVRDEAGEILFVVKQTDDERSLKTFTNSKGSTAKLRLPDGTTALLNSGSSITYPSAFGASERNVQVAGELYFEVARNEKKPFVVSAGNTAVRVLGTAFNITANPEENGVYTTLVEGSVEVTSARDATILVPGTQAMVSLEGNIRVKEAQLRDVLAWKDGYFSFNDYNIDQVMEQLRRWYDIEDIYIEARTADLFVASITRTRRLSEMLEQLEKISNYKFKIEGRRVSVMK